MEESKNIVIVDEKVLANYIVKLIRASSIDHWTKDTLLAKAKDFHVINTVVKHEGNLEETLDACLGIMWEEGVFKGDDEWFDFAGRVDKILERGEYEKVD